MPRVGSSRIRTRGPRRQPLGQDDLLLVAAGERSHLLVDAGHADVELLGVLPGDPALGRGRDEEPGEQARQDRQRHVLGDREVQHQAFLVTVLRQVGDALVHGGRRGREVHELAAEAHLAAVAVVDPEEDPGDLGAAGAHEPGEPEDLAGTHGEPDIAEDAHPGQAAHLEQDVADRVLHLGEQRHRPADHVADEVGRGQRVRRRRHDVPAVAEHGRPIAQREDLVEPVADEQDRHVAVAEPAHDREEPLDLVGRQRRGRLVEDQHPGLDREGLGDLDQLLVRHRQAPDRGADVELDVELGEQRLGLPAHAAPVDGAQQRPRARGR